MKPPPPMPATYGSVTPRVALAATAASTALPPSRSTSMAVRVASRSTLAAAPPVPTAVGCWAEAGGAETPTSEAGTSASAASHADTPHCRIAAAVPGLRGPKTRVGHLHEVGESIL